MGCGLLCSCLQDLFVSDSDSTVAGYPPLCVLAAGVGDVASAVVGVVPGIRVEEDLVFGFVLAVASGAFASEVLGAVDVVGCH